MRSKITIKSGNIENIAGKEIEDIANAIYQKYSTSGGSYKRESFNSNYKNNAYKDLKNYISGQLKRYLEYNKGRLPSVPQKTTEELVNELVADMVPSERTLKKIFFEVSEDSESTFSFRARYIDACYLFLWGETREQRISKKANVNTEVDEKVVYFPRKDLRDSDLAKMLKKSLNPDSLHYIGLFAANKLVCCAHVLNFGAVKRWLLSLSVDEKLDHLNHSGTYLIDSIENMDKYLSNLKQGKTKRAVIDLEQGALFFYLIHSSYFVLGACLNQSKIEEGDRNMKEVMKQLKVYYGLLKDIDVN